MPAADSPHYHAAVLGLKLVAGVEMVLADAAAQGGDDDDAAAASRCDGPRWKAFVASLTKMGYFQEQLPGSALYNSLLQQAQAAFATDATVLHLNAATPLSPASKTTSLARHQLRSLGDVDADTWRVQHPVLPPADNDTWMRDGGPELDAELARRQAERDTHQQPAQQGASVEDVAGRIGTFMEGHGGVDGAQVPDALDKAVDVSMDVVLRELSAALGVPLGKAGNEGGGAVGVDDDVEDDDGESADEGSSFFSDPPTSDEDGDDDDVQQEEEGAGPSQGVLCVRGNSCVVRDSSSSCSGKHLLWHPFTGIQVAFSNHTWKHWRSSCMAPRLTKRFRTPPHKQHKGMKTRVMMLLWMWTSTLCRACWHLWMCSRAWQDLPATWLAWWGLTCTTSEVTNHKDEDVGFLTCFSVVLDFSRPRHVLCTLYITINLQHFLIAWSSVSKVDTTASTVHQLFATQHNNCIQQVACCTRSSQHKHCLCAYHRQQQQGLCCDGR